MKPFEKICIVCGEHYEFCLSCSRFDNKPRWMQIFHNENCHDLFTILNQYSHGDINVSQAREKLNELDLSQKDNIKESLVKQIDEIYSLTSEEVEPLRKKRKRKKDCEVIIEKES